MVTNNLAFATKFHSELHFGNSVTDTMDLAFTTKFHSEYPPTLCCLTIFLFFLLSPLVMCTARLQAVGQAKPGPIRPSQAGPKSRPEHGFGSAQDLRKPKPSAQAAALG